MSSLGESDIQVSFRIVGRVRVLYIFADSALFPRLGIEVGITLHESVKTPPPQTDVSLADLQMRDASGELRASQNADVVGQVSWVGPRRSVRATSYGHESQLKFACDLDYWRLEQLERRRGPKAPELWLQLWPILVGGGEILDSDVRSIQIKIPREQWLDFYSKVGGTDYEILEVQYPPRAAEQFQRAVARTREARTQVMAGEYDRAIALCRNIIEALEQELRPNDPSEDPLRSLLVSSTDERRGKEYAGIVSRIKQLAGFVHHEFGDPITYSRAEALFILRTTESILSLVGGIAAGPKNEPPTSARS